MEKLNQTHKKRPRQTSSSSTTHFPKISKPYNAGTKVFSRFKETVPIAKTTKPNGPRSKISSNGTKPISRLKKRTNPSINPNLVEKCTTPIKLEASLKVEENTITESGTKVPTPPIEPSVSPEIHFSSRSKVIASNSGVTPVCYGDGHILSGVADRRKCRRRGSLKGGFSDRLFSDENVSVSSNLDDSAFPLLAEASVNWHLSPSDRNDKVEGNGLGTSFGKTGLLGSPSFIRVDAPEYLVCDDNGKYSLSGSFSSGNKIQTPDTDSCSDRCFGTVKSEMEQGNCVPCELGLMSPTSRKEASWLTGDAPGLESDFVSPFTSSIPVKKHEMNQDFAVSYATTIDSFSVSEMKISWRDGLLAGGVIETDEEFDCCRCLSDEDDVGIEICEKQPEDGAINENGKDDDISQPKVLDYEPIISSKDKEKMTSHMRDTCAESICTNGVSLAGSADSDWTGSFSTDFFQV